MRVFVGGGRRVFAAGCNDGCAGRWVRSVDREFWSMRRALCVAALGCSASPTFRRNPSGTEWVRGFRLSVTARTADLFELLALRHALLWRVGMRCARPWNPLSQRGLRTHPSTTFSNASDFCCRRCQGRRTFLSACDGIDPISRTRTAVPYQRCGTRHSGW